MMTNFPVHREASAVLLLSLLQLTGSEWAEHDRQMFLCFQLERVFFVVVVVVRGRYGCRDSDDCVRSNSAQTHLCCSGGL